VGADPGSKAQKAVALQVPSLDEQGLITLISSGSGPLL
jgi:NAD-dependent DNA ligase